MGDIIPPFTFEKKTFVSPIPQVSSSTDSNNTSPPGSGLSIFSQMNQLQSQIAGPMEGIDDVEDEVNEEQWINQSAEDAGEGP